MKIKGSITIFLAFLIVFVLGVVGSLLESARIEVSKEVVLDNAYLAMQNILAEYQRELWDDYHVFFVDEGALDGDEGICKMADRYLLDMVVEGNKNFMGTTAQFSELGMNESMVEGDCKYFVEQVSQYMKESGWKDEIQGRISKIKNLEGKDTEIQKELEEIRETAEKEKQENLKNPIKVAKAKKKLRKYEKELREDKKEGGFLLQSLGAGGKKISGKRIQETQWKEYGDDGKKKVGIFDKSLFFLYIKKHFPCFLSDKEVIRGERERREALDYGIEYIAMGKNSDEENLEAVVERIFGIRTTVWYTYFLSRPDKMAEATSIATAAVGVLGPAAVAVAKMAILMSWSGAEAKRDVRTLLDGGEVRTFPGAEGIKISYEGFLDLFLLSAVNSLPKRTVKLIEQNMMLRYNKEFRADDCFCGIIGEVEGRVEPRIFRIGFVQEVLKRKVDFWSYRFQLSESLCR